MTNVVDYMIAYTIFSLKAVPLRAWPSQDISKYEEYIVEHEISSSQANYSASLIDLKSIVSPPGCQSCTRAEKYYCLGRDFINDHCCCDRRHREELPFVPHTCYLGTTLCKTIAQDCVEYTRLRACCCKKYVLEKWKEKSSASTAMNVRDLHLRLLIFAIAVYMYL